MTLTTTSYEVWACGPSAQVKLISRHDSEAEAMAECARLNEEEQAEGHGATGWHYVVDDVAEGR